MRPQHHLTASSLVAGASFLATQSWPIALTTLAAGFLIDADHIVDYTLYCAKQRKRPSFREIFFCTYPAPSTKIIMPLHCYEVIPVIWIVCIVLSAGNWALWISLSLAIHLLMDYVSWTRYSHPLFFLLAFRMNRGFSYELLGCHNREKTGLQEVSL